MSYTGIPVKLASALAILTSPDSRVAPLRRYWVHARASTPSTVALNTNSVTVTASGYREGGGYEDRVRGATSVAEDPQYRRVITCWQSAPCTDQCVPRIPGRNPPTQRPCSRGPSYSSVIATRGAALATSMRGVSSTPFAGTLPTRPEYALVVRRPCPLVCTPPSLLRVRHRRKLLQVEAHGVRCPRRTVAACVLKTATARRPSAQRAPLLFR